MTVDISVVVNGHREGGLASATLRSVDAAVADARDKNLRVEVILVLDRGDAITSEVFHHYADARRDVRILIADVGDLGLARNAGVRAANGRFVAFVDGDDLWGRNWLSAAKHAAEADARRIVWHPELSVIFGAEEHVFVHVDMEDPEFDLSALVYTNCWTALCFCDRDIVLEYPYLATRMGAQLGYEDWSWHIVTVGAGVLHKVVPSTSHLIRRKRTSLLQKTNSANCVPHPADTFRLALARGRERREAV